uniref:UDP-N-acetylglucosamine 2-epimerase (Non-hydrolyzing) n=1 Tax=Ignisphaera aggregans TaxID=334771 RepID=A0A7J3Z7T9_9CREN
MSIKVVSIVGARPNYVKLAAVYEAFKVFEHVTVDTGQHYDYEMNRTFYDQLGIPEPHYFLGVGRGSHAYQVGEIIKRAEEVLLKEKPDIVVVYGDTNSALGGAIAAVKAGFKVTHVEAGLRSFDMNMPEEVNRRVIDHVSSLLFAPTETALNNLRNEKVLGIVHLVGDVHVYILEKWLPIAEERSNVLGKLGLRSHDYILVTLHRAENVDDLNRLVKFLRFINKISQYYKVVFPIHPRTKKNINQFGLEYLLAKNEKIIISQPLGYIDFIKLMNHSRMVLTDSGGVQREAYLLRKPVVVLRKNTEWVELVEHKQALLCDPDNLYEEEIIDWKPGDYVEGLLGDESAPWSIAKLMRIYISSRN